MKLSVIKNNDLLTEVDFDSLVQDSSGEAHFYIGRLPSCHVCIADKIISREHAILIFQDFQWSIRKNSNVGNLFLNGRKIEQEVLNDGDTVQIGPYSLIFKIESKSKYFGSRQNKLPSRQSSKTLNTSSKVNLGTSKINNEVRQSSFNAVTSEENNQGNVDVLGNEIKSFSPSDDNLLSENELIKDEGSNFPILDNGQENNALIEAGNYDSNKTEFISGFAKVTLELFGPHIPFDSYTLDDSETLIGRNSEECIIFLDDQEVSAVHARIVKSAVKCFLEDLGSSNGTVLNGQRIKREELNNGDEIIIGTTTITVRIVSQFLKEQESRLMPVAGNQEIEIEQIVDVADDGTPGAKDQYGFVSDQQNKSLFSAEALKDPERRKKLIYIVIGILILWVFLDEDKPKPPPASRPKDEKIANAPTNNNGKEQIPVESKISPEDQAKIDNYFNNSRELINAGKYEAAMLELEKLFVLDSSHANARILYDMAKENFAEIERIEREKREELEKKLRIEKINKLVEHAKIAVTERKVELAENIFAQVLELDPNNFDVPQLRLEINAYVAEEKRKEDEKKRLEEERRQKVDQLRPAKAAYLQQDWHRSIILLKKFLNIKIMDEDLITEATSMLKESQDRLNAIISPLLGKARSLKEGQDLKGAYEEYIKILTYDPANQEAHNEMAEINQLLFTRSRRIYRYGIISESLSLFDDAKQKFLEVQQVSPSDSEYYIKATDHLKEYWD